MRLSGDYVKGSRDHAAVGIVLPEMVKCLEGANVLFYPQR